uniref:Uncharacterized protein n=1 Tax=Oryza nivara TaxID=4536 RepID=A0A0E0G634_ORYNI
MKDEVAPFPSTPAELFELSLSFSVSLSIHVRPSPPPADLLLYSSPSSFFSPLASPHSGDSIFSLSPPLPPQTSHHQNSLSLASSHYYTRRSGHPPLSLCLPAPSLGAPHPGTPSPADFSTPQPPEHRRLARPLLSLLSAPTETEEEDDEKKRRQKETPPWKLYAFYGDIRVVLNPDVKPKIVKPGIT